MTLRLTPDYFADRTVLGYQEPNMISVYNNAIRFTKGATSMLNLPEQKIAFVITDNIVRIEFDSFGWHADRRGVNNDMVISRRQLCATLLNHFKAEKKVCLRLCKTAFNNQFYTQLILKK